MSKWQAKAKQTHTYSGWHLRGTDSSDRARVERTVFVVVPPETQRLRDSLGEGTEPSHPSSKEGELARHAFAREMVQLMDKIGDLLREFMMQTLDVIAAHISAEHGSTP